jgi:hypothetical protein
MGPTKLYPLLETIGSNALVEVSGKKYKTFEALRTE